jgi:hypothetical protein
LNDELEGGVVDLDRKPSPVAWHGDDETTRLILLKTEPNTRVRLCFDAVAGNSTTP